MYSCHDVMKIAFLLLVFLLKTYNSTSENNTRYNKQGRSSNLSHSLKNKESLRLSQSRGTYGDVTAKCNVVSWVRSWGS